ncbi:MAG: heme ABC exporter ATP-binding protein CcmA [Cardiobacteriaceae bacterium]|nr:heme ABC exporter ATP-binding protein CcmA [Cardiobacteriaceae bacterium]
MQEILLSGKHLTLVRGNRAIIRKHHIELFRTQAIHLKGENGSGKTTLLQALAGLSPLLAGKIDYHAPHLYLGHQSALQPYLSIRENLYYSARMHHGLSEKETQSALDFALDALQLLSHQHREARYLSAGQQHKVQLARLWLPKIPDIWLLDEPLTALDTTTSDLILKRIDEHLSVGGGVIMTTHHAFQLPNHPLHPHALCSP